VKPRRRRTTTAVAAASSGSLLCRRFMGVDPTAHAAAGVLVEPVTAAVSGHAIKSYVTCAHGRERGKKKWKRVK
jgi:hypothetical protein